MNSLLFFRRLDPPLILIDASDQDFNTAIRNVAKYARVWAAQLNNICVTYSLGGLWLNTMPDRYLGPFTYES